MPRDHDYGPHYEVGYGKPPRHTRFEPGVSGNPHGRPKDAKNLSTLVHDAASAARSSPSSSTARPRPI